MSDILILSDPHVHMHKSNINRLYDCLKCLRWAFQTAVDRNIEHVVCAGDFFQDRQRIHMISYVNTFNLVNQYFSDGKRKLWILVGNHDMWFSDKWEVNSVAPLSAIPGVEVIDSPCTLNIGNFPIDFLPYTKNPINEIKKYFIKKSKVLVGHIAVHGALLNSFGAKAEVSVEHDGDMEKVDLELFSGWERVFLGHYHRAQQLNDKVEYIGSPLELNFSEAFQEKHILILNTETLEREYLVNNFSPKHLIVKQSQLDHYVLNGNFVQVLVDDITTTDILDLRQSIVKKDKVATLEFKETPWKKKEEKVLPKVDLVSGDVLEQYVGSQCSVLDKMKLLTIAREICETFQEKL